MIFSREIKKLNWWVQAITKLWECLYSVCKRTNKYS